MEPHLAFSAILSAFTSYHISDYVSHRWALAAGVGWFIVGLGATWAVFHRDIRDTVWERVALAFIAMGALSRTFFVIGRGDIPIDGVITAVSLAFYVLIVWYKHTVIIPRRRTGMPERRSEKKT